LDPEQIIWIRNTCSKLQYRYVPHLGIDLGTGGEDLGVGSFVPQVLQWIRNRSPGSGTFVANYNPHLGIDLGTGGEDLGVGSLVPGINLHGVGENSRRLLQVIELGRPSQIIREKMNKKI
jgi:hypothetical protein